jgi:hypothetical protein
MSPKAWALSLLAAGIFWGLAGLAVWAIFKGGVGY